MRPSRCATASRPAARSSGARWAPISPRKRPFVNTSPVIIPGDIAMADDLAPRLRAADADELRANGREPLAGLRRAAAVSAQLSAITEPCGRPLALFGFVDLGNGAACPWLLGSDDLVDRHRGWFIRNSQTIVRSGDHRWGHFWNRVDARNILHIRWLRWVGFGVGPAAPHGPYGLPFHSISRINLCAT